MGVQYETELRRDGRAWREDISEAQYQALKLAYLHYEPTYYGEEWRESLRGYDHGRPLGPLWLCRKNKRCIGGPLHRKEQRECPKIQDHGEKTFESNAQNAPLLSTEKPQ